MLVLTRKKGERIMINGTIEVVVLSIHRSNIKLGISAPPEVSIERVEVPRSKQGQLEQPPPRETSQESQTPAAHPQLSLKRQVAPSQPASANY